MIGGLDLNVQISGYVRESYSYEVVEGEMVKHSTVGRRERGKRNRGLLYRNKGYRKYYRFGGDRIDHDVPSYDRNRIGIEDKQRKDDLARIGGSEGMCRMDNPLDSGQEDDTESTQLGDQREQVGER